jgi:hypothetical protein
MTSPSDRSSRIGRVPRWQRYFTHGALGACALSGVVWFVLMDGCRWLPPRLTFWWIAHGVAGFVTVLALGSALPQHVVVSWRGRRNRLAGGMAGGLLLAALLSALALLYGPEAGRAWAHWLHVLPGLGAACLFPWHVARGRGHRPRGRPAVAPARLIDQVAAGDEDVGSGGRRWTRSVSGASSGATGSTDATGE